MADVIAYNGSDKWKQKATELLNQGTGGGGNVDDVKVNGTSVVDANKVAQIDLTPYTKTADLATVATSGDYDDLQNKPTIPAAQVQSDWLEADTSAKSYILNKPTIPSAQVQSDWNEADSSAVDYIKNKPNLATVATSGSYNDLSNKPSIPAAQVNSDWNASSGVAEILNKPSLATVATSGSYNDLTNKPTIPSAQVNSDWNASSGVAEILNKPNLATVATSGSYTDLSNKPTDATQSASGLMSSTDKTKLDGIASGAEANVQSDWSQSDNTADDYIKNKPTIPTVNDGTLTLKNGDQTKGTFSANQSTAANVVMLPFDITGNTTIGFTPVYPS